MDFKIVARLDAALADHLLCLGNALLVLVLRVLAPPLAATHARLHMVRPVWTKVVEVIVLDVVPFPKM